MCIASVGALRFKPFWSAHSSALLLHCTPSADAVPHMNMGRFWTASHVWCDCVGLHLHCKCDAAAPHSACASVHSVLVVQCGCRRVQRHGGHGAERPQEDQDGRTLLFIVTVPVLRPVRSARAECDSVRHHRLARPARLAARHNFETMRRGYWLRPHSSGPVAGEPARKFGNSPGLVF